LPPPLAHSSRTALVSRLTSDLRRAFASVGHTGACLHTFYDDIATALVTVTFAVASVSALVTALALI
jgi:hypothetical protein